MRKRAADPEARGEASVIVFGIMLAGAAAAFAGVMLYTGPLLPGRDFRLADLAANRQNDAAWPGPADSAADPIITGSLPDPAIVSSPRDVPQWFSEPGRPIDYRLRSVSQGNALVDVSSGPLLFTYKVEPGGLLPGLGRVRTIGFQDGSWQIITGRTRISSTGAKLVRD